MLYEAIREGCQIYHQDDSGTAYNRAYDELLRNMDRSKWDRPVTPDLLPEVIKVRNFINQQFRGRMQATASDILSSLQDTLMPLNLLRGMNILSVDFNEELTDEWNVGRLIEVCFDNLAKCGPRYESTGTSKILHAINPDLFVMWDDAIRGGYALGNERAEQGRLKRGTGYVRYFLPRMQRLAKCAVSQIAKREGRYGEDAIRSLRSNGCPHTLAKIVDEYNYAKFTLNDKCVWKKEYDS